jgi:hypothetical protein
MKSMVSVSRIRDAVSQWSHTDASASHNILKLLQWFLYLSGAALLLRPILLTNISADDLVNPFSQVYHAGTSIDSVLQRAWGYVAATGHFNYIGQTIGSLVLLIWIYIIGDFGIRYSLVYATTKFIIYMLCLNLGASVVQHLLASLNKPINIWKPRVTLLIVLGITLQIHVPWSNDPVASYPLSGFLTTAIGVLFIFLVMKSLNNNSLLLAIAVGLYGACTVLYYEYNAFAVLAVAPLLIVSLLAVIRTGTQIIRHIVFLSLFVLPAAGVTIYFYLVSNSSSVNYSGTSLSLSEPFFKTFTYGLAGAFPASSWNIANDWLAGFTVTNAQTLLPYVIGLISLGVVLVFARNEVSQNKFSMAQTSKFALLLSPFVIYWIGATFTQTATVKVQTESTRLGQVYNYYAVAVLCLAIVITSFLFIVQWSRIGVVIRMGLFVIVLGLGGYQYSLNWNVMEKFNSNTTGTSRLLAVYADKPEMKARCDALNVWKNMGWPEYYWLDMELGLNASYKIFHGEYFCDQ